jgi:hypothetical protein
MGTPPPAGAPENGASRAATVASRGLPPRELPSSSVPVASFFVPASRGGPASPSTPPPSPGAELLPLHNESTRSRGPRERCERRSLTMSSRRHPASGVSLASFGREERGDARLRRGTLELPQRHSPVGKQGTGVSRYGVAEVPTWGSATNARNDGASPASFTVDPTGRPPRQARRRRASLRAIAP